MDSARDLRRIFNIGGLLGGPVALVAVLFLPQLRSFRLHWGLGDWLFGSLSTIAGCVLPLVLAGGLLSLISGLALNQTDQVSAPGGILQILGSLLLAGPVALVLGLLGGIEILIPTGWPLRLSAFVSPDWGIYLTLAGAVLGICAGLANLLKPGAGDDR